MRRNRLLLVFLIHILLLFTVQAKVEFSLELFEELASNINPIPYIKIPEYRKVELENGMVFYLAQEPDLPIIEVVGFIRGGMSQESMEQADRKSVV